MATACLGHADLLLRNYDVSLARYRPHWIRQPPDRYRATACLFRHVDAYGQLPDESRVIYGTGH